MNLKHLLDRLELDDNILGDYQIKTLTEQLMTLVDERNRSLSLHSKPNKGQLVHHRVFVESFEQPRPERAVHLDRAADNPLGERVEFGG